MRKIATVKKQDSEIRRLMIYESYEGVFVFLYTIQNDGSCESCEWYRTLSEAEDSCLEDYGVTLNDWKVIDDPHPDCQHDWIAPTRVRRDLDGKPIWGEYEQVDE